jgi:hypothetical protein
MTLRISSSEKPDCSMTAVSTDISLVSNGAWIVPS